MAVFSSPQKVESDAEKMINTLFQEVDQVLQINSRLQRLEGTKQSNYALPPSNFSQRQVYRNQTQDRPKYLPGKYPTSASSVPDDEFEFTPKKRGQSSREASASGATQTTASVPWMRHLDKIIFSSSCCVLVTILLLWEKENQFPLVSWEQLHSSVISPSGQVAVEEVKIDTNRQFLGYMERALVEIDRDRKLAEKLKTQPSPELIDPIADEPSQAIASAPQPASQATTEPPQPKTPQTVSIAQLPALPPPPPPQPVSSPAPKPSPSPEPTPETEETPQKISQESSSPQETTPKPTSSPAETTPEPTPELFPEPSPEKPAHTLIGLIDLGSHSAVLFKVGETTKRVMLEETIPGSNWRLISVNDQEAIFEQNQQRKIMSVGEKISVQ